MSQIEARNCRKLPMGMNWAGFTCDLYVDNKKVATARDDGNGGMYMYHGDIALLKAIAIERGEHLDLLVAEAVDRAENRKRLQRLCKTRTVFKLQTDPDDIWQTIKVPYAPEIGEFLRKRHGADIMILNEQPA